MNNRVAEYNNKLVASGVRLTPQRLMVLEVLAGHEGHITADSVLAEVQKRYPYVNKSTVYRTLEMLVELGMVVMTDMGGNQYEYELHSSPHHHLICKSCGHTVELSDDALNPLRSSIESEYGFRPCFDHFALFGVCQECRAADAVAASRPNGR